MKKLKKILFSKKVVGLLLILLQIGVFYLGFTVFNEYTMVITGGTTLASLVVIFYILNCDIDGGIKLSWIILIALVPVFGICLYIFVRMDFPSARIKNELSTIHDSTSYLNENDDYELSKLTESGNSHAGILNYLYEYGDAPVYTNTRVDYFPLGDDVYPVIIEKLKGASKFIFIEFFILNEKSEMWKEIFSILKEKVREGVEVRVMYDGMGSITTASKGFCDNLRNAGIQCEIFAPIKPFLSTYQNNRDHRKIIVIDGKVAFSGGINIADEYINRIVRFGHWKDNGIMLRGESVKSFTIMFLRMWQAVSGKNQEYENYVYETGYEYHNFTDGYVVPFDESPSRDERICKNVYEDIINRASDYVYIMTPYLVLDESLREAIKCAGKKGVDIRIIMPHIADKWYAIALARTYYPELIKSGVKIYEYTKGFVHSKTTLCDDERAVVGTINYDYRSMFMNYECGVYLQNNSAIDSIKADFEDTFEKSKPYTLDDYYRSSPGMRIIGRFLRVFAPLM